MDKKRKKRLTLNQRIDAPTPRIWRIMRHIGYGIGAAGAIASVFLTGGGTLPLVAQIATIVGGGLVGASQIQVAKPGDKEALNHIIDTIEKIKDLKR